jgi:hypothetical protein
VLGTLSSVWRRVNSLGVLTSLGVLPGCLLGGFLTGRVPYWADLADWAGSLLGVLTWRAVSSRLLLNGLTSLPLMALASYLPTKKKKKSEWVMSASAY